MKIDANDLQAIVNEWNCELQINKNNTRSHKYFIIDKKTTQIIVSESLLKDAQTQFDKWTLKFIEEHKKVCLYVYSDHRPFHSILNLGVPIVFNYNPFTHVWKADKLPEKQFNSFFAMYKNIRDFLE
ncbi:hypothetical protein ELBI_36 [Anabaena phage Elbi]|nr:hypothetical protein ELBI_36 [Anabaena phage Elbi]